MVVYAVDLERHHGLGLEHLREVGRDLIPGALRFHVPDHRQDQHRELLKVEVDLDQSLDRAQGLEVDR